MARREDLAIGEGDVAITLRLTRNPHAGCNGDCERCGKPVAREQGFVSYECPAAEVEGAALREDQYVVDPEAEYMDIEDRREFALSIIARGYTAEEVSGMLGGNDFGLILQAFIREFNREHHSCCDRALKDKKE